MRWTTVLAGLLLGFVLGFAVAALSFCHRGKLSNREWH